MRARVPEMMNSLVKFHCSGIVEGKTLSYPMEISDPSLSSVMSMSMSTGSLKKSGHSTHV
eukprot:169155-Hanusia_phi.AAC.1